MLQAFFSLYCLLKNILPPEMFFKFFKEQNLFFFRKIAGFWREKYVKCKNFCWKVGYLCISISTWKKKINEIWHKIWIYPSKLTKLEYIMSYSNTLEISSKTRTNFLWKVIKLYFFCGRNLWFCSFFQEMCRALKRTMPGTIAALD